MDANTRKIRQSPIHQGEDERIAYVLDTSTWGGTPSSPATVVKDSAGDDVTADHVTGLTTASGDNVTTGTIHSLTAGEVYRLEIKFTIAGNVEEAWANLIGED